MTNPPGPAALAGLIGFIAGMFVQMALCARVLHPDDPDECRRIEHLAPHPGRCSRCDP